MSHVSNQGWCDFEVLNNLPIIQNQDHPLSLDYKIVLASQSKFLKKKYRTKKADFDKLKIKSAGLHMVCTQCNDKKLHTRFNVIAVREEDTTIARFIAIVVHELSHVFDEMVISTSMKVVDTELRAYYLDFMTEKFVSMLK